MKILAIADTEEMSLYDYWAPSKTAGVDLIISCGDLKKEYLEFLTTMVNRPLLYVPGNHDSSYETSPPEGCDNIDQKIYDFQGLRIMGLGGSRRYKDGPYMYTEAEMKRRIRRMSAALRLSGGVDLVVTHAPCEGYGDMEDLPHRGFACFNELLEAEKPMYFIHGHVHREYGDFVRERNHPSGTKLINACGHYIIDIDDEVIQRNRKEETGLRHKLKRFREKYGR